jgi:hypothetical protein
MRGRRGGRQQLQEIESRPFAREERASRAGNGKEELVGYHRSAFGDLPVDPHRGVQPGEDGVDIRHAAQDRGLTGDDRGTAGPRRRNECRREVAAADIFLKRPLDLGGQILRVGNG